MDFHVIARQSLDKLARGELPVVTINIFVIYTIIS